MFPELEVAYADPLMWIFVLVHFVALVYWIGSD